MSRLDLPSASASRSHADRHGGTDVEADVLHELEQRLGRVHARQRLGVERDHEARVFGDGLNFFHIENWFSIQSLIRRTLQVTGLYWRGRRNARRVQIRENVITRRDVPAGFDGFTILQISDPHIDMNARAMRRLVELLDRIEYDLCVLTGDYRGQTVGPFAASLEGLARIQRHLKGPVYAVLGNHDTIQMVPGIEAMGIRLLLNETVALTGGRDRLYLAGIDDAHYYRVDNIEKAASQIPTGAFSVLLSHTPEIYRQAAHAGFHVLLCGHTHGGQICLPGGIPLTLDSSLPRRLGAGAWTYHTMNGYTSVGVGSSIVPVRFNCLPEITLHRLRRTSGAAPQAPAA